jgi:hypothetical protein
MWEELRDQGVGVLGCMPGSTRTPGYLSSKPRLDRARLVTVMDAAPTVAEKLMLKATRSTRMPHRLGCKASR